MNCLSCINKLFNEAYTDTLLSCQVDQFVSNAGYYEVVDDWDCMLNQTNIGQNNNKYYVIQLLKSRGGYYNVWNRWGRVVGYIVASDLYVVP